jgi:hypothetical protein
MSAEQCAAVKFKNGNRRNGAIVRTHLCDFPNDCAEPAQDIDAGISIEKKHGLCDLLGRRKFRLQRSLEIRVCNLNGPKETARPTPLALRHQNHAVTFLLNVYLGSFEPELFRQPYSLRTSAPEKFSHFHVDTVHTDQNDWVKIVLNRRWAMPPRNYCTGGNRGNGERMIFAAGLRGEPKNFSVCSCEQIAEMSLMHYHQMHENHARHR